MIMGLIWTMMTTFALLYGAATGRAEAVGAAAMEGARAAAELMLAIGGMICLWSGVMELMSRCGASQALSGLLRPLLRRLYPKSSSDPVTLRALCHNLSANLLGLGNAATPAGITAVSRMERLPDGAASDELCRLVVMNTASIQLIPTTIAAVRTAAGAQSAFDILPAVWLSSLCSVAAGLLCASLLQRFT